MTESPVARDLGAPETARRVAQVGGATYYLMRGAEEQVCLVRFDAPDLVGAVCTPWEGDSLMTAVRMALLDPDGGQIVAILLPDGYGDVTVERRDGGGSLPVKLEPNVAFVTTDEAIEATIAGREVEPLTLEVPAVPAFLR